MSINTVSSNVNTVKLFDKSNCSKCKHAVIMPANVKYHLSDGNKKLVPNQNTAFFIWNLPARITCPYATENCKKYCYAVKAEKAYKQVLPARMDNFEMSKLPTFVTDMTEFIISRATKTKKGKFIVRVHESGDFYNKEYTEKWLQIMQNCEEIEKIHFIAYTKSFKFFDGVTLPKNFSLRASVWSDTKPDQIEIIKRNNWNIYTAVEKFTDNDDFHQCRCEDCAGCGKCWDNSVPLICCEIH